jgi:hypothetical protein
MTIATNPMKPTPADGPAGHDTPPWRAVISASIGNALEWFDLVVYGFFAGTTEIISVPKNIRVIDNVSAFLRPARSA